MGVFLKALSIFTFIALSCMPAHAQLFDHNYPQSNSSKANKIEEIDEKPKLTDEKIILQLYQMMKDVHEVLVLNKIEYWAQFGTLLGAVRHQGIIPWDDDLDICIENTQLLRLFKLAPLFNKLGYSIESGGKRYSKITPLDKPFPFLDIFYYERKKNCFYLAKNMRSPYQHQDQDIVIHEDDVYPLRLYKFGEIFIYGPNEALKNLEYWYGPDCLTAAHYGKDHEGVGVMKKMQLNKLYTTPAMPTGPLKDRVKDLVTN